MKSKNRQAFLVLVILLLSVTALLAQETQIDPGGEPAFVTLNLEAGFVLDPFVVSVNGGGEVDASELGEGCVGYINSNPTIIVEWTGEADFLQAFFYSDYDPVLVVQTPDGEFLCSDDTNSLVLDPAIELLDPPEGHYAVWVGSFAPHQLIPGFLVFTANPDVNIGTFNPGALVTRKPVPASLPQPDDQEPDILLDTLATGSNLAEVPLLTAASAPVIQELTVQGELPAFDINLDDVICAGYINPHPSSIFNLGDDVDTLRIFFEATQDTTLIVGTPDGEFICNDDADSTLNLNPLVDIGDAVAGEYRVFVGSFDPAFAVEGTLTISTSTDLAPDTLAAGSEESE